MQITPLGDTALLLELGDKIDEKIHHRVLATWQTLTAEPLPGVSEVVPAYTTVTVYYDPAKVVAAGAPAMDIAEWLKNKVQERLKNPPKLEKIKPRTIEVPVCYGGDYGPDLALVARHTKLSAEEVIKRHSKGEYLVYLIGFSPGFPYLGGLPKELQVPRHAKPRTAVAPGSVGIAGEQTGIYPLATPGGWNLIGRTPLRLFRPMEDPPVLLHIGDRVKFNPITPEEYEALEGTL